MSATPLNFMPLVESYIAQQQIIKDSHELVQYKEAMLEKLVAGLQKPELTIKQLDTYLREKSSVDYVKKLYEADVDGLEKIKQEIMEILSNFPNLTKIKINSSRAKTKYLLWDLEERKFTLSNV